MLLKGTIIHNNITYTGVLWTKGYYELVLMDTVSSNLVSAYKVTKDSEYVSTNGIARDIYRSIKQGIVGMNTCPRKNITSSPFVKGQQLTYSFKKGKVNFKMSKFLSNVCGVSIASEALTLDLAYYKDINTLPSTAFKYVKIKDIENWTYTENAKDRPPTVRTLAEISLDKDTTWLKGKRYKVVDTAEEAERLFAFLDTYDGPIAFDTETTGLKINQFGKYGSRYRTILEEYNKTAAEPIVADKLTGFIFCWEKDVSYYFPVGHRFIKNLYDTEGERQSPVVAKIIASMRKWAQENPTKDFANYINNTKDEDFTCDALLMHRCREILTNKYLIAHNGAFEWKVCFLYDIVFNLKDDTMIMHQLMYKFRSTTSNRGESSSLKHLAFKELNINQLELTDFFVAYTEQASEVRQNKNKKNKQKAYIDFSYMDEQGTWAYAPADGDVTFQIYLKYKQDLITNHSELEYLYTVELNVACMIGYMEFSGHRIDEKKIEATRIKLEEECRDLEQKIRAEAGLKEEEELNLGSSAQMSYLFFEHMKIPFTGEKASVSKNVLKTYLKSKTEDGKPKYPIMHLYSDWKKKNTLITKFFDNLQYYMFPEGFIFSHYGQIAAATGRMSCSKPNAQQYPKVVTQIVIPRDNCVFCDADYSQIEYRVLVGMAQEHYFLEKFADPDTDYHTLQASNMYGVDYAAVTKSMRSDAKSFNFGIPYGMGFKSLALLLFGQQEQQHVEEAMRKYELYFKDQPKVRGFFEDIKEAASIHKYTSTVFKRRRYYSFVDKEGNPDDFKKAQALRQAGNAVIQGTAADIFKIAVARLYLLVKNFDLFGAFYVSNMIHDECLMEIDVTKLNPKAMLREIVNCMQFQIPNFPPLFVGAGFDMDWAHAKGGDAELHPNLVDEMKQSAKHLSIFAVDGKTPRETIDHINEINSEFRCRKVRNYLLEPDNKNKLIHPVIGSMLNTFFSFGLPACKDDAPADEQALRLRQCTRLFLEYYGLDVSEDEFMYIADLSDQEDDVEFEEDDDMENDDNFDAFAASGIGAVDFACVDQTDVLYGVSIQKLIEMFGMVVSKEKKIIGIDLAQLSYTNQDELSVFLAEHTVTDDHPGAMKVVFLDTYKRMHTLDSYVAGIDGSSLAATIKLKEQRGVV